MASRSFSIIVIFIVLSLVGCALVPFLPVKLAPSRNLPSLTVSFSMQGSSARTIEAEVTSRIESVLARVSGVKGISSKSSNGGGRVSIDLDKHADIDMVRFEVSTLFRQIWSELPEGVSYPSISARAVEKESSRPFMVYRLNAPANPSEIQTYGEENLKPLLARIPGVYKVELNGAQPMEWQLHYDIDRLSSLGLTPSDLRQAIREHYTSEFLGMAPVIADEGDKSEYIRLSLHTDGTAGSFIPSEISVRLNSGLSVTLDKLVSVIHTEAAPKSHFRINGLNSIYVNITSEEDANQLTLAEEIRTAVSRFETVMPEGYMIDLSYDATESIRGELDKIYFRTGLTVLILLLFVGLVTLNFRYVLMITIGLTINLAVAAVFYYLAHIEIQLYTLAGITISLNLVIDNLIVMADHYTRRRNLRAFTAILAATITTIGALSVVYFMDEKTRLSLEDFVTVVIINLSVSLAVALLLVPALVERLGLQRVNGKNVKFRSLRHRVSLSLSRLYASIVRFMLRFRVAMIVIVILSFGLPVFMLPDKIEGEGYWTEKYNSIFGSPTYREKIRPVTDIALGGTLRLFVEKVYNGSYWDRDNSEPVLHINATLPNGATLRQMDALVRQMEAYLCGFKEIRQFQTSVSSARRASISVMFNEGHQHDGFPYRLKGEVISKALTLGGGSWSVYGLEDQGFSNDVRETAGSYRVKMTGYNYDELSDWAYRMRDTLLTHRRIKEVAVASEFSNWKDDYTEVHLVFDRDRMAKYGITATQLFSAIKPTFGREINCGQIVVDRTSQRINLYSIQSDAYDIFTLIRQPFTVRGRTFKLSDIGSIEKRQAPQDIVKKNQEYVMCLQYEYIGSNMQGDKVLDRDLEIINVLMPVGYKAEREQRQWKTKDESGNYLLLLLVMGIIFFTTSILFNSLRQPFAIIFIIPVSFIGVFASFYLFKLNFDQGGFASFILLAGITVNAAIYILNEYNSLQAGYPQMAPLKTYLRAFRVKIVPILLTVMSTILGFIPFIIGESKESFWFPLAIGTMGGLAVSILAILLILPILVIRRDMRPRN